MYVCVYMCIHIHTYIHTYVFLLTRKTVDDRNLLSSEVEDEMLTCIRTYIQAKWSMIATRLLLRLRTRCLHAYIPTYIHIYIHTSKMVDDRNSLASEVEDKMLMAMEELTKGERREAELTEEILELRAVCICMCMCMFVCVYVYVCVCVCVYIYIYIYIYIYSESVCVCEEGG